MLWTEGQCYHDGVRAQVSRAAHREFPISTLLGDPDRFIGVVMRRGKTNERKYDNVPLMSNEDSEDEEDAPSLNKRDGFRFKLDLIANIRNRLYTLKNRYDISCDSTRMPLYVAPAMVTPCLAVICLHRVLGCLCLCVFIRALEISCISFSQWRHA